MTRAPSVGFVLLSTSTDVRRSVGKGGKLSGTFHPEHHPPPSGMFLETTPQTPAAYYRLRAEEKKPLFG